MSASEAKTRQIRPATQLCRVPRVVIGLALLITVHGNAIAATGDVISSFPSPSSGPFGLAWDGTSLWNGDDNTGLIFQLDTLGNVLSSFGAPCTFTKGLTFDGTNLWTACDSTDLIYEITQAGTIVSTIPTPGPTARGLTWDGTNLWIADASTSTIYEVTTGGSVLSSFTTPGSNPRGLTWDGASLWHADAAATDLVYELSTTGTILSSFVAPGPDPRGLTFDGTNFWIADQNTDTIYELEGPPTSADLTLTKTDSPDPAPAGGPLLYTLLVTNNGPATATEVAVVDTLPASVTLVSSTPSQGACGGVAVVTCKLGAILNGGTASIEILVTTGGAGTITNNATVTATEADPVPADNAASEDTDIVVGGTSDIPLTQYVRLHGFLDSTVTGGSLRTQPNPVDPCAIGAASAQNLAGIPATAAIRGAYLYWAGSGSTVDSNVTLDAAALAADRTFTAQFVLGATSYDFFGGFKDVTAQVAAKRNGLYNFGGLTIDNGGVYCSASAVVAGWSMLVVYEDTGLTGKTLVVYDGFDLERNGSTSYLLSGIYASGPPEAKTTTLLWEGDETLGGTSEQLLFNAVPQSDALNPVNNVYNSTINSIGVSTSYGVDLDTFDVSALVSVGDTLATTRIDTGPDLVILNTVLLQVKTNVIVGTVFEDVNYGGGAGRDYATAKAAAPAFAVERPGATVELYDAGGNLIRTTVTGASGGYGFTGLPDGDYTVRVVNETVISSRPGATGTEWSVQTFRTDASGAGTVPVTNEVGGADPTAQDDPPNLTSANLSTITAQSLAPVTLGAALTKADVDFGYNFDTIVNSNDTAQGSLRQFIINGNALTNANLAQDGLTAGKEHSLFMIPSDTDPLGRPQDPNFDAGRGVAVFTVTTGLPGITDADTSIDGTTQTADIGNTNAGLLGTGGTVGVDGLTLSQVAAPEVEIRDGAAVPLGILIQGDNAIVSGLAMLGFGAANDEGAIRVDSGAAGALIENNILGSTASSFSDPGAALRNYEGVDADGATGGTIRNNLIGFGARRGIFLQNVSTGWTVDDNEIRDNGLADTDGDGISINQSTGTFTGNLITGSSSQGFPVTNSSGNVFTNNTVTDNGVGTVSGGVVQSAAITLRPTAGSTILDRNVIRANYGSGVQVNDGAAGIRMTRNAFFDNGTITARDGSPATAQIGIDLNSPTDDANLGTAPFFTLNDSGDADLGGNGLLNNPVPTSAVTDGSSTTVTGIYNGISGTLFTLEFFSNTVGDPSGYGEGQTYRGTDTMLTDGAGNGSFSTVLPVGVLVGQVISMTATDPAGNTSEFSANVVVGTDLEIVKRAFLADGTPIPSSATMPNGLPFYFMLYINNANAARTDIGVQDVLDPAFAYQTGTLRIDNSVPSCAVAVCTPAEEAAIFAAASGAAPLTDAVDGDVTSYTTPSTTVDAGNQNVANGQLDIAADRVWVLLFSSKMQ